MNKLSKISSVAILSAAAAMPVQAEMFWSDNSITLLHSDQVLNPFSGDDQEFTTMTIEHVSGHNWGDAFFFMDRLNGKGPDGDFSETYSEVSPRISSGALMDKKLEIGPIKDVLLAMTYESNSQNFGEQDNYLYGVGFDWAIPGFAFFQTNIFYANNENTDNDMQLTLVYGVPFTLGEIAFMLDGYIDWSSAEDDHASDFHFNPQIRADVGKFMGMTKSKLEAGIEYSFWSNKFGVKTDDNESAVSAIIKFHL